MLGFCAIIQIGERGQRGGGKEGEGKERREKERGDISSRQPPFRIDGVLCSVFTPWLYPTVAVTEKSHSTGCDRNKPDVHLLLCFKKKTFNS